MHVIAGRPQVSIATAIHRECLVAPAEKMPESLMSAIKADGVSAQEPLHAGDQIRPGRFQHQVKVGFHQTIGMDLPVGLGACLGQGLQKGSPIHVVAEDGGFAIAAAHEVINGAPILDPQFSGHEEVWPALCKVSISYYQGPTPKTRARWHKPSHETK